MSSLDDPVRGRLYEFASGRSEPVGRDEAAAAVGISRALAAYHLDKLAEPGLPAASYRRPPGRSGPDAGRSAKVYARSSREFAVTGSEAVSRWAWPPTQSRLRCRVLGCDVKDGSDMTHELAPDSAGPLVMAAQPAPDAATLLRRVPWAAPESAGIDPAAAQRVAADFLAALRVDLGREDLRETPARMARADAKLCDARPFPLTTFPNDEGYDRLVLACGIPFRTVREHLLLPFSGVAHVGYLPAGRILGLSKLARLVEHFAARPQTQERLTKRLADCLLERLRPRGAGVVLEAEHSCMTLRGVRVVGAKTVTSALHGSLRANARSQAEFFALADVPS